MRFGRLDLNLLIALDHLLDLRSITQAANKMNLTQSAMSSALRRLREYFEDPLLVQVGREMELTPRACALKTPLRQIIVQIDATLSTGLTFDPAQSTRQFRIILSDYTLGVFAPRMLALASKARASVRIRFLPQVKSPSGVIERGDAELLIAPSVFMSSDHPSDDLFTDDFVALVWSGSALAEGPLTLEGYLAAKHVVVVPPTDAPAFQSDFMAKMGIHRNFEIESFSFLGLAPLVIGTDRIATLHGQLAHTMARTYPLTMHRLPFDTPRIVERLQWHRHMTDDPAIIWLRDLAQRAARQLMEEPSNP